MAILSPTAWMKKNSPYLRISPAMRQELDFLKGILVLIVEAKILSSMEET
jgi:hypothetical protein